MGNKKGKIFGILIVFIAFLIASLSSLAVTNPSVLDTNPATYIIVVMLMLFVFILFCAKSDIEFEYSKKNILYAALVLVIYLFVLSCLRVSLSTAFLSYRIDALLFPLLLVCFIILVFGLSAVKKLLPLIVYSLFASPLLLIPILNLNNSFANINARFVYWILKAAGAPVSRQGLAILSRLGATITISGTCVAIGTFVAFVMFLIPIAYLYDGKLRSKLYWVLSGIVLILVLNTIRMLLIALMWVYYGLGGAVTTFHLFAGQLIFYVSIVIMILLAGRYKLSIRKAKKGALGNIKNFRSTIGRGFLNVAIVAIIFAVIALVFNLGYVGSIQAPYVLFGNSNVNKVVVIHSVLNSIQNSGSNITVLSATNTVDSFLLSGVHGNLNKSAYAIARVSYSAIPSANLPGYVPVGGVSKYNLNDGITVSAQSAYSGNSTFELNYFSIPYNLNGSYLMVNYLLFEQINLSAQPNCQLTRAGKINGVESYIYNLFTNGGPHSGLMCQSYLIASSA